jgi:hypothetical protein
VIGFVVIVAISAVLATVNQDWAVSALLWFGVALGAYIAFQVRRGRQP